MGSRAQRPWFGSLEQTEERQQRKSASTPAMSDTSAAATLKRIGNGWEAVKVVHNIQILSSICPNYQGCLNFQGQNKGSPDMKRAKIHMK